MQMQCSRHHFSSHLQRFSTELDQIMRCRRRKSSQETSMQIRRVNPRSSLRVGSVSRRSWIWVPTSTFARARHPLPRTRTQVSLVAGPGLSGSCGRSLCAPTLYRALRSATLDLDSLDPRPPDEAPTLAAHGIADLPGPGEAAKAGCRKCLDLSGGVFGWVRATAACGARIAAPINSFWLLSLNSLTSRAPERRARTSTESGIGVIFAFSGDKETHLGGGGLRLLRA